MQTNHYKFSEIAINFDKKRIPLSAMEREKRKGEYRYYGAQGIIDYIDDYIFDGKYLLIAEDGENLKSNKQNIAQIVNGKFWVNNHAHIIQTNDKCNIDYLNYYLNSTDISGYITGSAQPKLSQANLNNIDLVLPDIKIQEKITSILLTIDEKIAINNATNNNLEQQAQAVFLKSTNSNNFDNKLLSEVATIKYGKGLPTNKLAKAGYKVFGGNGIIGYYTEYLYKEPQILISCRGAASGTILESHPYSYITNNSLIVELNDRRYYEFLKQYFLLNQLHSYATGSAQPQITIDNLKTVEVPYPNYEVISDIDAYFTSISNKIYENICENEKLASLRDTLLPRLMKGEIDVSNVDISTDKLSFICQIILIFHILHILYIFQTFISHRYR